MTINKEIIKKVEELDQSLGQLKKMLETQETPLITEEQILKAILKEYKCTVTQLKGASKSNELPDARKIWAILLNEYITTNRQKIANIMNRNSLSASCRFLEVGWSLLESSGHRPFKNHYNNIKVILLKK